MQIIEQSSRVLWVSPDPIKAIEYAARLCYKSEDKMGTDESSIKMIKALLSRKHDAMIEHACMSIHVVTDRGITHEFVRHRIASFAQESTRYCNYSKGKFGNEIQVVKPLGMDVEQERLWRDACLAAEKGYLAMIAAGCTPQVARDVLPTCTKTEMVITTNFREWRHFLSLRYAGTTGAPHPKMQALATLVYNDFRAVVAPLVEDIQKKATP